jgi:hypothetical protein
MLIRQIITLSLILYFGFMSLAHSEIQLQPHQKIPPEYLMNHPEQKGLLLYHSLGSGKTFIALDYAEKNPTMKVVLFLPEFLKSNWVTQMKQFGVKDALRYEMISLNEGDKLLAKDLSNTIVIVDEIHRLVQKLRTSSMDTSDRLIRIYEKLKTSKKLLVLTGTPIFLDTSDISYVANLFLEDNNEYPIDPIKFRTQYMKVKPLTSLTRGHVTESKLIYMTVPFWVTMGAVVTLATSAPLLVPLIALGGSALVPIINEVVPANQVAFREFNTEKWKDFSKRFISYYHVNLAQNSNYPNKNVSRMKVAYNENQANFFLGFVDEDLDLNQLKTLLAEEGASYSDRYLKMHSTRIQKDLLSHISNGRDIGNLDFRAADGQVVESPKFLEILDIIKKKPGQIAVYSSYFQNGIQKFAAFLDRYGMKDDYIILNPSQSVETQISVIDQYNQAKKRILLIHPEITEGISLKGTEQFHILEPLPSTNIQDQIIGRAIRYRSHLHLPENRRVVNVYLWEAEISYSAIGRFSKADLARREHWQKKYSEINPSTWSKGISDLDTNYFLKDETPDRRTIRNSIAVEKDVDSFGRLLENYSIEKD